MTARDLIKALQNLGEDNLDKEVVMFDDLVCFTPYKVEIASKGYSKYVEGKIVIE